MEQLQLAGKFAIVTGGGRGLGRAMALGLAAAGAVVVVSSASGKEDCHQLVEQAVDTFGGLHILVNNAGRGMKFVSDRFLTEPARF